LLLPAFTALAGLSDGRPPAKLQSSIKASAGIIEFPTVTALLAGVLA
ncbi:18799_t:CDS:1, partial [Dentiscutata erythropus]